MTPPKVAIFTSHPIQYQAPWFADLARDPDLSIHVFFSYVPDPASQGVGFGRPLSWDIPLRDGYRSDVLTPFGSKMTDAPPRFVRNLGDVLRRSAPDVAVVLGWHHPSLVQAMQACRVRHIPVVLRGESNNKRARPWWVSALHRVYVAQASAYLAIGTANEAFYREAGVPQDRIAIGRYCVDNDKFLKEARQLRPQREAIRAGWGIRPGSFCAAFVGKLEPKKRVMDVLQALAHARADGEDVQGLIVGAGAELEAATSFAQAHALPVTFAGFLNQTEISRAYVAADALVLPSDTGETWGLVCNEAMACGTPAIVSEQVGCAGDLVVDGVTGAVVPFGTPRRIAQVLSHWSRDPSSHEARCVRAVEHVTSNYTIGLVSRGLKEAIGIAMSR